MEKTLDQVDHALAEAASEWRDDLESFPSISEPLDHRLEMRAPSHPVSPGLEGPSSFPKDADDCDVDDPMMADFQSRIQSLISSGQAALAAQPDVASGSDLGDSIYLASGSATPSGGSSSSNHTRAWTMPLERRMNDGSRSSTPTGIPRLIGRPSSGSVSHRYRSHTSTPIGPARSVASRSVSGIVTGPDVKTLEAALDETAKGPSTSWWES